MVVGRGDRTASERVKHLSREFPRPSHTGIGGICPRGLREEAAVAGDGRQLGQILCWHEGLRQDKQAAELAMLRRRAQSRRPRCVNRPTAPSQGRWPP